MNPHRPPRVSAASSDRSPIAATTGPAKIAAARLEAERVEFLRGHVAGRLATAEERVAIFN